MTEDLKIKGGQPVAVRYFDHLMGRMIITK